jgi:ferric-dicitrate binding protein FerR (iron transport regulator)
MTGTTPPTASSAPAPSRFRRLITPALAVVAALAIGLFGGILISHANAGSTTATGQVQPGTFGGGTGGGGGGAAGGGFTAGTIESIDGSTITLKLADGSTVKVTSSSATTVTKAATATVSALKAGESITVVGTKDASGNVTATSVSEGNRGFGGRAPTPAG